MKFSHSLKFNAVPEWQDNYVNYPTLKKTIYRLQQQQLEAQNPNDGSYTVDPVNRTTVSELISSSKFKKNEESFNNESTSEIQQSKSKFHPSKLVSRFKKSKNNDDIENNFEVENGEESKTSEPNEKGNSTQSFTFELGDNSTIFSFKSDHKNPKSDQFDPLKVFVKQLLDELTKIDDFYKINQEQFFNQFDNLIKDLESNNVNLNALFNPHHHYQSRSISRANSRYEDIEKQEVIEIDNQSQVNNDADSSDDDEEDLDFDDDDDDNQSQNSALLTKNDFDVKEQKKITLKRKSITLFISLSELKSFIELNKIGFTKITKKFDKTCNYSIKQDFNEFFLPNHSYTFNPDTLRQVDVRLDQIVKIYAFLTGRLTNKTTEEELESIRDDLKSHLRDHIVWERNTVWKDLLSLEKNSYNLQLDNQAMKNGNKMGDEGNISHDSIMFLQMKRINFPKNIKIFGFKYIDIPRFLLTWQIVKLAIIIPAFIVLLSVPTFNDLQQHRCMAVLAVSAMLWASEALPLYITAMLVPLLIVTCKVLKDDDGNAMTGEAASKYILGTMWSSVIMLLMGGFTLAAALSKYNIAKVISSYILAAAGTKPRNILLAIMSVSVFLSMWISNVAAPVLCFSLIQPVLRTVPTDSPFAQALVLGIALSSNIAGMSSPISSPQNMIAIESMNPSPGWGKWFAVALPVSIIGMLGIWVELILTFNISKTKVKAFKPIKEKFTVKQWFISIVTIVTILLWCLLTKLQSTFGESGIVSCIPIILFFGTGLLKVDDLNNFPWNIVLLAMGGIALGKGVSSSGLLKTIATSLQQKIMGFNVFVVLIIFGILILVVATFVSHTVAALIIIPLVKEIGESLPDPHPLILVMGTALLASAAMALPTSGFPNVTAISMRDDLGKPYLTVNTFITRGIPASIIGYICVITLGYGIMNALGF